MDSIMAACCSRHSREAERNSAQDSGLLAKDANGLPASDVAPGHTVWILPTFSLLAVALFVVGFSVQDWESTSVTPTGGATDKTWGCWLTDYLLALECLVMALFMPGKGMFKTVSAVSFLFDVVAWGCGGVLHQFFYESGTETHDALWVTALVLGCLGPVARVCASQLATAGRCSCCAGLGESTTVMAFSGFGGLAAAGVLLAEYEHIAFPAWMIAAVTKVGAAISMTIYGFVSGSPGRAVGVFLSFALSLILNQYKFAPFMYSEDFNDNGLFHTASILYYALVFHLFDGFAWISTGYSRAMQLGLP